MHSGTRSTLTGSFAPNMFFSDEPGYYEDGSFGIRLETILRVIPINNTITNTYGKFDYLCNNVIVSVFVCLSLYWKPSTPEGFKNRNI